MSLYDELLKAENQSVAFPKLFDKLTIGNEILSNLTLELTPYCNFKCDFCYARLSPEQVRAQNKKIKGFDEWKRYLDEAKEMNCLTVAFTGGECTLHPDFVRLYRYAYDLGFVINVFSNLSNLTDEIIETFKEMPPSRIFATIYGNTPETYKKVTGREDCCEIVKKNMKLLASMNFDLVIQATLSVDNYLDADDLFDFAKSLGCEFRYTNQLQTYGNCTPEMKEKVKVTNKKMQEVSDRIYMKKIGLYPQTRDTLPKSRVAPIPDNTEYGIKCNAGKNACFIKYDGTMLPCNSFDAFSVDTNGRSLKECFKEITDWVNRLPRIKECQGCIHAIHCTSCVAAHYNDTHKEGVPSPLICFKILEPEKARKEQECFDKHGYIEV